MVDFGFLSATEQVKLNDKKFKSFDFLQDNLKIVCSAVSRSLQIYDNFGDSYFVTLYDK